MDGLTRELFGMLAAGEITTRECTDALEELGLVMPREWWSAALGEGKGGPRSARAAEAAAAAQRQQPHPAKAAQAERRRRQRAHEQAKQERLDKLKQANAALQQQRALSSKESTPIGRPARKKSKP